MELDQEHQMHCYSNQDQVEMQMNNTQVLVHLHKLKLIIHLNQQVNPNKTKIQLSPWVKNLGHQMYICSQPMTNKKLQAQKRQLAKIQN